jgi:hypothetical protein
MEYKINPHITSAKLRVAVIKRLKKIRDYRFVEPYDKTLIRPLISGKKLQRPQLDTAMYILNKYRHIE